jgi:hypothetical protein
MNPPYERKYHPDIIVKNVLNNCSKGAIASFLLPDKKLEKFSKKWVNEVLGKHRLRKIIKLPEKTFDEGVTVSIFIFECHKPQKNEEIFTCYIKDDGLERVKNQGRQDVKNKWQDIENLWIDIIKKQTGDDSIKWINPNEFLSYQKEEEPFSIYEEDFIQGMMNYLMYKEGIDVKELSEKLVDEIIHSSEITKNEQDNVVSIRLQSGEPNE